MEDSPELEMVQQEYLQLAQRSGTAPTPLDPKPMKDRDLFDFLGFD
jgi:light-independent protochlorophyllide reductase subunit L